MRIISCYIVWQRLSVLSFPKRLNPLLWSYSYLFSVRGRTGCFSVHTATKIMRWEWNPSRPALQVHSHPSVCESHMSVPPLHRRSPCVETDSGEQDRGSFVSRPSDSTSVSVTSAGEVVADKTMWTEAKSNQNSERSRGDKAGSCRAASKSCLGNYSDFNLAKMEDSYAPIKSGRLLFLN